MELYNAVSQQAARQLTLRYSTSFGIASRLFRRPVRQQIYNIYGLVRIADEIVDTYQPLAKDNKAVQKLLDGIEQEVYQAIECGYSPNVIVHAFCMTARQYGIGHDLIAPFFASMRMDIVGQTSQQYDQRRYETYIHGSAEVIGLMCLRVFVPADKATYKALSAGARRLGAAYQKVNFLRDIAADRRELGRSYFPDVGTNLLTEDIKAQIIKDIEKDFEAARTYVVRLPSQVRPAVKISLGYYQELLRLLSETPAVVIEQHRLRLSGSYKIFIAIKSLIGKP